MAEDKRSDEQSAAMAGEWQRYTPKMRQALADMRAGRPVVLTDDDDRENEADLIMAASRVNERNMALMIRECSGIVCLCMREHELLELALPPMVARNESRHGTAFTISIDARSGITTGVSAKDRVRTIRAAVALNAKPADLVRPGHIFPLCAKNGGVLERRGHTEGAVDLSVMAGLEPAGVLCELMNADGSMMRGKDVERFANEHGLTVVSINELAAARAL
jgi:3,4-dihydroxy 2-butanone 4-phosphate synthase